MLRADVNGDAWALAFGKKEIARMRENLFDLDNETDDQYLTRNYKIAGREIKIRIAGEYEYIWARTAGGSTPIEITGIYPLFKIGFGSEAPQVLWHAYPDWEDGFSPFYLIVDADGYIFAIHRTRSAEDAVVPTPPQPRYRLEIVHPEYGSQWIDSGLNPSSGGTGTPEAPLVVEPEYNADGNWWHYHIDFPGYGITGNPNYTMTFYVETLQLSEVYIAAGDLRPGKPSPKES